MQTILNASKNDPPMLKGEHCPQCENNYSEGGGIQPGGGGGTPKYS